MTYIGQQPATTFDSGIQDRFTGLTTNTVTLTHDISAEEDILVVWNNIVQDKNTYSVGGTGNKTVTLGGTLVSADVVTVYYLNKVMQSVNPTAGSVNTDQLADLGVTGAKLNTDVISAQTALGATPADTDELLVSDDGVLKRVDYSYLKGGDNTPSFYVYIDSNLSVSHNTQTLVPYNQEVYDIGGCFNNTGSNATLNGLTCPPNGFCPNEAGYYYFNAQTHWHDLTASQQASGDQETIQIYTWFSSVGTGQETAYKYHFLPQITANTNMIFYFNGTGNCMQMRAYQANSSSATKNIRGSEGNPMTGDYTTYLHGFKLIT